MNRSLCRIFVPLLALALFFATSSPLMAGASVEKTLHILCTTFPLYQLTRNLSQGREAVQVDLLLPAQLGCPHDYALTPKDMQLLSRAEVLVVNGLGLEEFLGAPIKKANPALVIIDSSEGVVDLIHDQAGEGQGPDGHAPTGVNPHLFASPRLTAQLATHIASKLALIDPDASEIYRRNGQNYAAKMMKLDREVVATANRLANKQIICQHGVFDYLARDMGLEVVAVVEAHAGQEPSAAEMLALIKTAKLKRVGGIFSEPQYPAKVLDTIAKEAGINVATLDPVATGPEDAGLDYYEQVMAKNMQTLQVSLGVK